MFIRKAMTCLLGGLLVLWSVAAFADNAKDVNVVNTVEWQFIGVTMYSDDASFRFGGLRQIPAMHKACEADYGLEARAANMSEALIWGDVTLGGWERAWLVPGPNAIIASDTIGAFIPVDATTGRTVGSSRPSAYLALGSAFCGLYASDFEPYRSPVLTFLGQFGTDSCASELPVACAAPVEVPVTR